MEPDTQVADAAHGIPTRYVEAFVAAVLMLVGVVMIFESQRLGSGWTSDGPGSGYFPFYIGVILTLSAGGILYQALHSKKEGEAEAVFVDGEQLRRVLSVLLPAAVYILGVFALGLYVASAIYIALFMIILGKYTWLKSVVIALAVNTVFFMMFEVWFKVPLYKGLLDPLGFLA